MVIGIKIPMDSLNRKTLFWLLITLAISLFILFLILAVFIDPTEVQSSGLIDLTELNHMKMVWILALMLFLGPIIMILVTAATIMLIRDVNTHDVEYQGMNSFKTQVIGKKPVPEQQTKYGIEINENADAVDDLNLRFIRGEISKEEYDELKSSLGSKND